MGGGIRPEWLGWSTSQIDDFLARNANSTEWARDGQVKRRWAQSAEPSRLPVPNPCNFRVAHRPFGAVRLTEKSALVGTKSKRQVWAKPFTYISARWYYECPG
jgi:hypothetical protein